ncbi:MAG: hypothetical protein MMC23_007282 [Stictis urceolatum]|nr:hypothetical protein [Stictis urceolata]
MAGAILKTSLALAALATLTSAAPRSTASLAIRAPSGGNGSSNNLIPNGKKAGSAGGAAVPFWQDHLGWYYDWTPSPEAKGDLQTPSMLWGDGENGDIDAQRYQEFQQLSTAPKYLLGFNEPDCSGENSASMQVDKAVQVWNDMIAPWGEKGSLLGSPSMCMQKDESWLQQFSQAQLNRDWDFTAIHVYKIDMDGVQQDIDHYWNTYQKPIWVTEFACVDDQNGFTACSDQGQINQWINDVVDLFENNEHVMAYGYTDGGGLNDMWLPTQNGQSLTESGQTYLNAISKYD